MPRILARCRLALFFALLLPMAWESVCFPSPEKPKVVLFVVDGISYRTVLPHGLRSFGKVGEWLERNSSVALLNTMGYGGADRFRSAMSLACGVRAFGNEAVGYVLGADEPFEADTALDAYRRRLGHASLPSVQPPLKPLVFPLLAELQWRNERMRKKPLPFGIVARSLRQRQLKIVGIGCGDVPYRFPSQPNLLRHGLLLTLNEKGLGVGATGTRLLRKDPTMPFGIAVDEQKWRNAVMAAWKQADVLVLFPGETVRADYYGSQRLISYVLQRELQLLQPVLEQLDLQRDLLLVFSLAPSMQSRYELSVLWAVGKNVLPGGLLTSSTTHRQGLVSILDISATVLDFYGVLPEQPISGAPIRSVPFTKASDRNQWLWGMGEAARHTDSWGRFGVLVGWCVAQTVLFGAAALFLLLDGARKNPHANRWQRFLSFGALCLISLTIWLHPISAGLNLWLQGETSLLLIVSAALLIFSLLFLVWQLRKHSSKGAISLSLLLTFGSLLFVCDGAFRGLLSANTPFGYSFFFGGRYYGLGNVGMGLTLGVLLAVGLMERTPRWATAILVGLGTVLVGAPFFGGNVGGALTGIATLIAVLSVGRWRWWHGVMALAFAFFVLGAFAMIELSQPEPLTHWGRLVHALRQEGLSPLLTMMWMKLGITFRAFRGIHWNIAWSAQLLLLFVLRIRGERGWAWNTLLVGSLAALLLNDSGPQTPVAFAFFPLTVLTLRFIASAEPLANPTATPPK